MSELLQGLPVVAVLMLVAFAVLLAVLAVLMPWFVWEMSRELRRLRVRLERSVEHQRELVELVKAEVWDQKRRRDLREDRR